MPWVSWLAFAAIQNQDRVGLILLSDEVEGYVAPRKGVSHVLRVIREVLYFQPKRTGTRIQPALDFLNHVTTRKTVTFLISDFITDEHLKQPMAITARRHDLINIVIGDKRERSWPSVGLVDWMDAETGRRRLVDTSDAGTRRAFSMRQAQRREDLLRLFRTSGIDIIQANAGEPYEREFIKFFKLREQRLKV